MAKQRLNPEIKEPDNFEIYWNKRLTEAAKAGYRNYQAELND